MRMTTKKTETATSLSSQYQELDLPKSRRGRDTREALQQAALDIFYRDGYINARVADIATQAGVSTGAFYRYFVDKRHVMLSIVEEFFETARGEVHATFSPADPLASVTTSTELFFRFYRDNRRLFRMAIEVGQADPPVEQLRLDASEVWYRRIAKMLERAKTLDLTLDDFDPKTTAALLGGMAEHYAYLVYIQERSFTKDPIQLSHEVTRLWRYAVFR
jgi:AcrR family transcriptional regulator